MHQFIRNIFFFLLMQVLFVFISQIACSQTIQPDNVNANSYDTIYIDAVDTIIETRFVPGDTILLEKEKRKNGIWSASFNVSQYNSWSGFKNNGTDINADGFDFLNDDVSFGRYLSFQIRNNRPKVFYESGFISSSIDQSLFYKNTTTVYDTLGSTIYYSDTSWYYTPTDQIIMIYVLDTLFNIDVYKVQNSFKSAYRFSSVEIPLIIGFFPVKTNKCFLGVKGGIVPGIITHISHKKIPNESPGVLDLISPENYFKKYTLKGIVAGELSLYFYDQVRIVAGVYYMRSIVSAYKRDIRASKFQNSLGISIGLEYVFE